MTTTRLPPAAPADRSRPARSAATREYFELSQRVKDAGLMGRRTGAYLLRTTLLAAALAGATALLLTLGQSLWQLAVAVLFGVLFTQSAYLAHDGAHQQVFTSGRRNEWFSRVVGNLVVGLSLGWWTRKHNRHHSHPNTIGRDGDISDGFLVFVPGDADQRTGPMGWLARRQGWAFIPLLSLFAFVLHYEAVSTVVRNRRLKHRWWEAGMLAVRLIGFPVLVLSVLGPGLGAGFLAVQLAVFGISMGGSFAPNHKGMPLIPQGAEVDFLRRQVLTSRNITGGRPMDWAMGGLNLQIEHHLFPRMPSANLRLVRPIVKEFCAERGIPYTETDLVTSYGIIIRYLNHVGLRHSDPMECPLVSQLRPR